MSTMQDFNEIRRVALVGCSNGRHESDRESVTRLCEILAEMSIETVTSELIFAPDGKSAHDKTARAELLNQRFADDSIDAIFDLTGGDLANEVLPYLDFAAIAKSRAAFFGYSDLTTVINALASKSHKRSVLFQPMTLVWDDSGRQIVDFRDFIDGDKRLFSPQFEVFSGDGDVRKLIAENTVIGGNVRCLLKLAGTEYFPDMDDKLLFLESYGGLEPTIRTYFAQLEQLGVFTRIRGLLLGTFTALERDGKDARAIASEYLPSGKFAASTRQIGHAVDSRAILIG